MSVISNLRRGEDITSNSIINKFNQDTMVMTDAAVKGLDIGIAAKIKNEESIVWHTWKGKGMCSTNSAELKAVELGLKNLVKPKKIIRICTDSKNAIAGLENELNMEKNPPLRGCLEEIYKLNRKGHRIMVHWINQKTVKEFEEIDRKSKEARESKEEVSFHIAEKRMVAKYASRKAEEAQGKWYNENNKTTSFKDFVKDPQKAKKVLKEFSVEQWHYIIGHTLNLPSHLNSRVTNKYPKTCPCDEKSGEILAHYVKECSSVKEERENSQKSSPKPVDLTISLEILFAKNNFRNFLGRFITAVGQKLTEITKGRKNLAWQPTGWKSLNTWPSIQVGLDPTSYKEEGHSTKRPYPPSTSPSDRIAQHTVTLLKQVHYFFSRPSTRSKSPKSFKIVQGSSSSS